MQVPFYWLIGKAIKLIWPQLLPSKNIWIEISSIFPHVSIRFSDYAWSPLPAPFPSLQFHHPLSGYRFPPNVRQGKRCNQTGRALLNNSIHDIPNQPHKFSIHCPTNSPTLHLQVPHIRLNPVQEHCVIKSSWISYHNKNHMCLSAASSTFRKCYLSTCSTLPYRVFNDHMPHNDCYVCSLPCLTCQSKGL